MATVSIASEPSDQWAGTE